LDFINQVGLITYKQLLVLDPEDRMGADFTDEILSHPLFNDYDDNIRNNIIARTVSLTFTFSSHLLNL
jgi:hypothetical protein